MADFGGKIWKYLFVRGVGGKGETEVFIATCSFGISKKKTTERSSDNLVMVDFGGKI